MWSFFVQDGQTSLLKALSGGSKECVKLLLDRGAQTDQQDKVSVDEYRIYMYMYMSFVLVIHG